ncbi:hypothetical protein GXW71_17305 [Roseomonas hellenica]|uniref:Uncharacterized protein n=1 Tax=Plastoroseomonas hellenica TaxID=2687306 RepID=A0ABS5F0R4_9PROT|nr:O-methyltransferase [Plastoroseomonas hellenica]MBR0666121.1 hypothetical protein [Plastoroseomonas hellenica]
MTASYKKIDYRLRPAKHAERLIIAEIGGRLRFFDIHSYRYVGLGSPYFADFKLMHRALGISSMLNIEAMERDRERFNWNMPYATIDMRYGTTDTILPALDWTMPSIVWLDYDDQLSQPKLLDIDLLVRRAAPGSLLLFSVNAEPPAPPGQRRNASGDEASRSDFVEALRAMVGKDRVDPSLKHEDLQGWSAGRVYRRIMTAVIEATLAAANAVITQAERRRRWRQILNIEYKDGARMLTLGGVLYEESQEGAYLAGAFEKLSFFRDDATAYRIEVPRLTLKEMAHLERSVMHSPDEVHELPWLTPKERRQYLQLYRYLPNFVPAEI